MKIRDLTGKMFGRLFVKEYHESRNNRAYWKCLCDCGNEKISLGKTLLSGGTTSCGCYLKERIHATHFDDVTNEKYGFLVAQSPLFEKGRTYWKCLCDCGKFTIVEATKLKSGHTKSCGCLHDYTAKQRAIIRNKKMRGNKHPKWRIDLTDEERKKRVEGRFSDPKLTRWRKKVYERDSYTCQKCRDKTGGNLVGHHIYSWAYYPKLRYVTKNGITLCESCHKDFHKIYGNVKNTQKQFKQWYR